MQTNIKSMRSIKIYLSHYVNKKHSTNVLIHYTIKNKQENKFFADGHLVLKYINIKIYSHVK